MGFDLHLFTVTAVVSATLLLMVQPLAGRILLPVLGGSPAVWATCMVFFQAVLLLGYLYAHVLSTRVAPRWQRVVHGGVLVAASVILPFHVDVGEPAGSHPRWWMLRVLATGVGLPFFVLSATAPLLQRWFSRTSDPRAGDPYFLFAASNAGSLLGLLGYLAVEPIATRRVQVSGWALGFWVAAALIGACAYASVRDRSTQAASAFRRKSDATRGLPAKAGSHANLGGVARRGFGEGTVDAALWIVLALVPSALLIGVTQHLATDVVSAPLLWVAPFALYLATFIAAFSRRPPGTAQWWGRLAAPAALLLVFLSLAEVRHPILLVTLLHLAVFTVLAMMCHARLAARRPDAAHLTGYFLCVSLGGVLGGVASALVAPAVFSSVLEYPLAIGAAVLLRPVRNDADRQPPRHARRWVLAAGAVVLLAAGYWCVSAFDGVTNAPHVTSNAFFGWLEALTGDREAAQRIARASFAVPAAVLLATGRTPLLFAGMTAGLLVGAANVRTGGEVLHRERTFFGVHQVSSVQNGEWHVLTHGTTTHGIQAVRGRVHSLPTAYYHPSGPIGDVVFTLVPEGRLRDVAVVGLGAGALAAYAGNGVRMDFFEIDEAVIRIADDPRYFTYLADARSRPGVTVKTSGIDGRLGLRGMPAGSYDLIVIDAFSSDAIPTHLITREAVALYESRLKPRGLIAFHLSSRFFDLAPVAARIAADRGLAGYVRHDEDVPPDQAAEAKRASDWVVLARDENDVGQIARSAPRWMRLVADLGDPLWTDDYANVLGVLRR